MPLHYEAFIIQCGPGRITYGEKDGCFVLRIGEYAERETGVSDQGITIEVEEDCTTFAIFTQDFDTTRLVSEVISELTSRNGDN
jgi:hypothetical protein